MSAQTLGFAVQAEDRPVLDELVAYFGDGNRSAYLRALRAGLASSEYRPTTIGSVQLPSGQSVLRIEFAAPSPPGLLGPQPSS